uniref:Uncharacterized protein n=1 Tax=Percolomonas cosmopolitus TaxID=63605 RepID=A0A7S1KL53_9EUKA
MHHVSGPPQQQHFQQTQNYGMMSRAPQGQYHPQGPQNPRYNQDLHQNWSQIESQHVDRVHPTQRHTPREGFQPYPAQEHQHQGGHYSQQYSRNPSPHDSYPQQRGSRDNSQERIPLPHQRQPPNPQTDMQHRGGSLYDPLSYQQPPQQYYNRGPPPRLSHPQHTDETRQTPGDSPNMQPYRGNFPSQPPYDRRGRPQLHDSMPYPHNPNVPSHDYSEQSQFSHSQHPYGIPPERSSRSNSANNSPHRNSITPPPQNHRMNRDERHPSYDQQPPHHQIPHLADQNSIPPPNSGNAQPPMVSFNRTQIPPNDHPSHQLPLNDPPLIEQLTMKAPQLSRPNSVPSTSQRTNMQMDDEDDISDFEDEFEFSEFQTADLGNPNGAAQPSQSTQAVSPNSFDDFLLGDSAPQNTQQPEEKHKKSIPISNGGDDFFDLPESSTSANPTKEESKNWIEDPSDSFSQATATTSAVNNPAVIPESVSASLHEEEGGTFEEDDDEEDWGDFENPIDATPAPDRGSASTRESSSDRVAQPQPTPRQQPGIKDRQNFVDDLFSFDTVEIPAQSERQNSLQERSSDTGNFDPQTNHGLADFSFDEVTVEQNGESDVPLRSETNLITTQPSDSNAPSRETEFVSDEEDEEWGDFEENTVKEDQKSEAFEQPASGDVSENEQAQIAQSTSTNPSSVDSKRAILDLFSFEEEPITHTNDESSRSETVSTAPTQDTNPPVDEIEVDFDEDSEEGEWGDFVEAQKEDENIQQRVEGEVSEKSRESSEFTNTVANENSFLEDIIPITSKVSVTQEPSSATTDTSSSNTEESPGLSALLEQLLVMERFAEAAECYKHMQEGETTRAGASWTNLACGFLPSAHTHKFLQFFCDERVFAHIDNLYNQMPKNVSRDDLESAEQLTDMNIKLEKYEKESLKMFEIYAPTVRLVYACFKEMSQCQNVHYRLMTLAPSEREEILSQERVERYFHNIVDVDWVLQVAVQSIIAECGVVVKEATDHILQNLEGIHQQIKGGVFAMWNLDWKSPEKITSKNVTRCTLTEFVHTNHDLFCVYGGEQMWWKAANMWHSRVSIKPPKRIKR